MLSALALFCLQATPEARAPDPHALARRLHERLHDEPVQQEELTDFLDLGVGRRGFEWAFAQGEELFESEFGLLDGGGANVGHGQRWTRIPRADLTAPGEWATHVPPRVTGPNAQSCTACHDTPHNDGSGGQSANVHRDPFRTGRIADMVQRNTPHLFGAGAVQRLGEEMTVELAALRDEAIERVRASGRTEDVVLRAKDLDFGVLRIAPGAGADPVLDPARVHGVDADLVVRPFGWKGDTAGLRAFTRKALNDELGLQPVELVGELDGDHDGVTGELTVGDVTALTLYVAGQPRPTTRVELAALELFPLSEKDANAIPRGQALFAAVGCTSCHVPELVLRDPLFCEPSAVAQFRDQTFPTGQDPRALGVDPARPISFALDEDMVDNVLDDGEGEPRSFGHFRRGACGVAVELYGDLRRHDLGPELADPVDETGAGAAVFLTENLWGVGSTAPYMHDGRAASLAEAIILHGGEAAAARASFLELSPVRQLDLVKFLENLVLFKLDPFVPLRGPDRSRARLAAGDRPPG